MARMTNGLELVKVPNLSGPPARSAPSKVGMFAGRKKNGAQAMAIKVGIFAGAVFLAHYATQAIDWVTAKLKVSGKLAGAVKALAGVGIYVGGLFLEKNPMVKQYQIPTEAMGAVLGAPLLVDAWEDFAVPAPTGTPPGGDSSGTGTGTVEGRRRAAAAGRVLAMSGAVLGNGNVTPGGQSMKTPPVGAVASGYAPRRPLIRSYGQS